MVRRTTIDDDATQTYDETVLLKSKFNEVKRKKKQVLILPIFSYQRADACKTKLECFLLYKYLEQI